MTDYIKHYKKVGEAIWIEWMQEDSRKQF
jgi:hypothetical protein